MEYSEDKYGWVYYGRSRHVTGKSHFLMPDTKQTLCHLYTFTIDDMRYARFTKENNIFRNKLCRKCLELLRNKAVLAP
jgi:hypothetical protein